VLLAHTNNNFPIRASRKWNAKNTGVFRRCLLAYLWSQDGFLLFSGVLFFFSPMALLQFLHCFLSQLHIFFPFGLSVDFVCVRTAPILPHGPQNNNMHVFHTEKPPQTRRLNFWLETAQGRFNFWSG